MTASLSTFWSRLYRYTANTIAGTKTLPASYARRNHFAARNSTRRPSHEEERDGEEDCRISQEEESEGARTAAAAAEVKSRMVMNDWTPLASKLDYARTRMTVVAVAGHCRVLPQGQTRSN